MKIVLQLVLLTVVTSGAYIKRSGETEELHREKRAYSSCRVDDLTRIAVGDFKLSDDCTKKHICTWRGIFTASPFKCPANTVCTSAKCECKPGAKAYTTLKNGKVQYCRKNCVVDGEPMESDTSIMYTNCTAVLACFDGKVSTTNTKCFEHSSCQNSRCVCDPGAEVFDTTDEGKREYCKLRECKVDGYVLEQGHYKLSDDCSQIHQCTHLGNVSTSNYRCPEHTSCHEGRCKCDEGTKVLNTTHDGLVEKCEDPKCRVDNKTLEKNEVYINRDCSVVHGCFHDELTSIGFSCTDNTFCAGGKCVCKKGYEVTSTDYCGSLEICELKTCRVGFLILQEGDAKLNKDCTTMYTCSNGVGKETDNSCPDNSSCQDFRCVCDPGTELHSTTHGGLVEHCERQPVK